MLELTHKVHYILIIALAWVIEVILLAFYANKPDTFGFGLPSDLETFYDISLAGSVLIKVSLLIVIGLHIFKFEFKNYVIFGLIGLMALAILLIIIGAGLGDQYYTNYSEPVGFLFIQICIVLIAYLSLYTIYYEISNNTTIGQPQTSVTEQSVIHMNQSTTKDSLKQQHQSSNKSGFQVVPIQH